MNAPLKGAFDGIKVVILSEAMFSLGICEEGSVFSQIYVIIICPCDNSNAGHILKGGG